MAFTGNSGYTNFILQYWFIVVILAIGLIALILFNIIAYCYFSKRSPVDPLKIVPQLEEEERKKKEAKIARQTARFTNVDGMKSPIAGGVGQNLIDDDNQDLQQFRIDALASHNIYRQRHNAPTLQYCESLSIYAQFWAENMAKTGKLTHSPQQWRLKYNGEPLGENIITTDRFKITGKGLSDMWYSESFKHDFTSDQQTNTKSFTQMVWIDSKQVGFGRAKGNDGNWYACAHYTPAGNIPGEFLSNVYPLTEPEL